MRRFVPYTNNHHPLLCPMVFVHNTWIGFFTVRMMTNERPSFNQHSLLPTLGRIYINRTRKALLTDLDQSLHRQNKSVVFRNLVTSVMVLVILRI